MQKRQIQVNGDSLGQEKINKLEKGGKTEGTGRERERELVGGIEVRRRGGYGWGFIYRKGVKMFNYTLLMVLDSYWLSCVFDGLVEFFGLLLYTYIVIHGLEPGPASWTRLDCN